MESFDNWKLLLRNITEEILFFFLENTIAGI